jgi:hypothetical protein
MQKIGLPALALALLATASTPFPTSAATFQEDFSADPATRGWQVFGDTNLFQWNATNQYLQVTWDSSQPNSYFAHPLPFTLTDQDYFSLAFDLHLNDFASGVDLALPYPFELAVGFLNLAEAAQPDFYRGAYPGPTDLVEFDFFPDNDNDSWDDWTFGPSLYATVIDSTGWDYFFGGYGGWSLDTNNVFHVVLSYGATNQTLHTTITVNGQPVDPVEDAWGGAGFGGFFVDHLAVCSYSQNGQTPGLAPDAYPGSLLAHGWVDDFVLNVYTAPLAGQFVAGTWQAQFLSVTNRLYTLERSTDLQTWSAVGPAAAGTGANLLVLDPAPPPGRAFYRVQARAQ